MNDEQTPPPRMRFTPGRIRYFLIAVSLEVAFIVGVFFVLPVAAQLIKGCEACTYEEHFRRSVAEGFRVGGIGFFLLLIYAWVFVVPLAAVPPALGLILDHRRNWREEE